MTGAAFTITQIRAYSGYSTDKKDLSGTVHVRHNGTLMKFEVPIKERECALVFAIIADAVAKMMTEMSIGIQQDLGVQANTLIAAELPDGLYHLEGNAKTNINAPIDGPVTNLRSSTGDDGNNNDGSDSVRSGDEIPF